MRLLVSLHDVTPFHAVRLERAERLLTDLGVPRVTYLLVPRFHGSWDVRADSAFVRWCHAQRPFEVAWALHGFEHREPPGAGASDTPANRFRRRWLTDGEGEFLSLTDDDADGRLARGRAAFGECLGTAPRGFVPPAWLGGQGLRLRLRAARFRFTEDHRYLYDLAADRRVDCPVITWATRSWTRRVGSRLVNPGLARRWRTVPVLRIALHPFDFDQPDTVRSIASVLNAALRERTPALTEDVLGS